MIDLHDSTTVCVVGRPGFKHIFILSVGQDLIKTWDFCSDVEGELKKYNEKSKEYDEEHEVTRITPWHFDVPDSKVPLDEWNSTQTPTNLQIFEWITVLWISH